MLPALPLAFSMGEYLTVDALIALVMLTVMEIVLGIDNIVFIAIVTGRLPEEQRSGARRTGLLLALVMRVLLLLCISYIIGTATATVLDLKEVLPASWLGEWADEEEVTHVSLRDVILLGGGLFLLWTAVREIHHKIEGEGEHKEKVPERVSRGGILARIAVMDLIFSLDSVLTAVGMAKDIWVMVTAVVLAILVMILFANQLSNFVERHPTVKMLALSFLLLIGVVLITEAFGTPLPKGYVYFAMGFSVLVEVLNQRMHRRLRPDEDEGEVGKVRDHQRGVEHS